MRRHLAVWTAVMCLCGLSAWAIASSIQFLGAPAVRDLGTTLEVRGTLVAPGTGDVTVHVRAMGTAIVQCVNPAGPNPPPRTNRMPVTATGEQKVSAADLTGGRLTFGVTTGEPIFASARRAGCPNDTWTARITDVAYRSATIRVFQDGRVVLRRTISV